MSSGLKKYCWWDNMKEILQSM